jgi:hypothetical protein
MVGNWLTHGTTIISLSAASGSACSWPVDTVVISVPDPLQDAVELFKRAVARCLCAAPLELVALAPAPPRSRAPNPPRRAPWPALLRGFTG